MDPEHSQDDATIVEEIRWVYENWGELFTRDENGTRVFDEEVLKTVPSRGTIAMAHYALINEKGFFDRFVIKLLPKDASKAPEEDKLDEDRMAELDPCFKDMENFFSMDVEQEREPVAPEDEVIDF